ncbi:CHAD domain-containing protein [Sedimentitalea sp. XS_ASV28]|uniref:CHAD domain-containing protein n=1 Tax=Sedimentitalea sp. XS_ASV28 TaxID=3241296 RepID=UPI003517EE82
MKQTDHYCLPLKTASDLPELDFGKLTPIATGDETSHAFQLLDTFDDTLSSAGKLLCDTGDTLELLTPRDGLLRQPATRSGPFVTDLADGPVKAALGDVSPLRALLPVGEGDMQEAMLSLVDGEQKTLVRINLRLLTTQQGESIAIVTLQGLRGYDKALAQVREQILASGGAPLGEGSIYATLFPGHAGYVAKPVILIGQDEAAYHAANSIICTYLPIARANEKGIINDTDTEFLHDYRIALRKIRSVLSLFSGVYSEKATLRLKTRFSELMSPTGRLRDLDVYLAEKDKFFALLPNTLHPGLAQLFDMFADQRKEAQTALSNHLKSKAYRQEVGDLVDLFAKGKKIKRGPDADRPALDYSRALIWKRYRKVCKIAAGIDAQTEDEEVHRLRIQCKKLRYLMEFFGPVFPKAEFQNILKPLKRLQDNLGLFNDYSVQQDNLRALLDDMGRTSEKKNLEIAQSVGALVAVLHRKQLEERAKVMKSFANFNSKTTRDTFRTLFHDTKGKK